MGMRVRPLLLCAVVAALGLAAPSALFAQTDVPPRIAGAERAFDEAVALFESERYEDAAGRFGDVSEDYEFNRRSTAALLMAGKSMYRAGHYEDAERALDRFVRRYPTSRYASAARETMRLSRVADEFAFDEEVISVGILLPTADADIALTQSLFNGIRLAIDAHNASGSGSAPIRMVFRSSGKGSYAEVLREFGDMRVAAVLGPMYSTEAAEAAPYAEANRVTMVAPLATDEGIAERREYVFQANPTGFVRGRAMARFAVQSLRHSQLGIVAEESNELGERMAEGFEDEARRLGASLRFFTMLPSATSWFRLNDYLVADSIIGVQAVYLPIVGEQARSLIKAAMDGFDNLDVPMRLLGNKEWHELPSSAQASRYNAVYTTDFLASEKDPRVQEIRTAYSMIADSEPNNLTFVGFDLASYVAYLLTSGSDEPLHQALREAAPYQGVALRFDFRASNVNNAIYIMRYRDGVAELVN